MKHLKKFNESATINNTADIITMFGNNHTDPIVVSFGNTFGDAFGIYTFKGKVFCLNDGDQPFEDVDPDMQKKIFKKIESGDYEINPAFQ